MKTKTEPRYGDIPLCDDRPLWDTWMSMFHFPTLTVAEELGLFTLLAEGKAPLSEIAEKLSISPGRQRRSSGC